MQIGDRGDVTPGGQQMALGSDLPEILRKGIAAGAVRG